MPSTNQPPTPSPTPPDVETLNRLTCALADALPADGTAALARIDRAARRAWGRLPALGEAADGAQAVLEEALGFARSAVEHYLRLPAEFAAERTIGEDGITPERALTRQLITLAAHVVSLDEAISQAVSRDLIAQLREVDHRFGVGFEPAAPAPQAPPELAPAAAPARRVPAVAVVVVAFAAIAGLLALPAGCDSPSQPRAAAVGDLIGDPADTASPTPTGPVVTPEEAAPYPTATGPTISCPNVVPDYRRGIAVGRRDWIDAGYPAACLPPLPGDGSVEPAPTPRGLLARLADALGGRR